MCTWEVRMKHQNKFDDSPVRSPVVLHPVSHPVKVVQLDLGLVDKGVLEDDLVDKVVPGEAGHLLLHLFLRLWFRAGDPIQRLPAPVLEEMPPGGQQAFQWMANLDSSVDSLKWE